MESFAQAAQELDKLHASNLEWECEHVAVAVSESYQGDSETEINLIDTLGYKTRVNRSSIDSNSTDVER